MWGFQSQSEARSHPLVQEGDPVVQSPEGVLENWNYLLLPRMISDVLGDARGGEVAREEILSASVSWDLAMARSRVWSETAWDRMRSRARTVPTKAETVVALIREDRRLYDEWRSREQTARTRRTTMTEATTTETAAKPKTIAGLPLTATIQFGADKEGKSYGPDNNPKRAGSKAHEAFSKYAAGQTLEQAVAAGVPAADIKWDLDKKFIVAA